VFPSSFGRRHENVYVVGPDADEEAFNTSFYPTNNFLYRKFPLSRVIAPNMCDVFHKTFPVRSVNASDFETRPRGPVMTKGHSALKV
jgi:hypothetical protein